MYPLKHKVLMGMYGVHVQGGCVTHLQLHRLLVHASKVTCFELVGLGEVGGVRYMDVCGGVEKADYMSWHTLYQDMVAVLQGEHAQTAAREACKLSWVCALQGVRVCIAEMEVCFSKLAGRAAVRESFDDFG